MLDSLQHHGVLGMKWGVRKEEKRAAREATRQSTLQRLEKDKDENARLVATYALRGRKEVTKILDIIGKKPTRTVSDAINIRMGQKIIRGTLISIGAVAIGTTFSMIQK